MPELEHGVSLFLDPADRDPAPRADDHVARRAARRSSEARRRHGGELRRAGFTIAQVVHDYGDVCQAVTELAFELERPIAADEFRTLNRCLDNAIAQAVTEYARQRERSLADRGTERLGFFAHELRNLLTTAMLAFDVLKTGTVGVGGSTGGILGRSLVALRDLIDRSLAEVRLEAGLHRREIVLLAELIEEVEMAAAIEAEARGLPLTVTPVDPGVVIEVDRQLLAAALANLLQNAFKFSRPGGHVVLRTDTATRRPGPDRGRGRVRRASARDRPRSSSARSSSAASIAAGSGSGWPSPARASRPTAARSRVRNLPGKGCVFTVDLSRLSHASANASASAGSSRG